MTTLLVIILLGVNAMRLGFAFAPNSITDRISPSVMNVAGAIVGVADIAAMILLGFYVSWWAAAGAFVASAVTGKLYYHRLVRWGERAQMFQRERRQYFREEATA